MEPGRTRLRLSPASVAGKLALIKAQRYAHAKQFKRQRREVRFLRVRLGRLIRDLQRVVGDELRPYGPAQNGQSFCLCAGNRGMIEIANIVADETGAGFVKHRHVRKRLKLGFGQVRGACQIAMCDRLAICDRNIWQGL